MRIGGAGAVFTFAFFLGSAPFFALEILDGSRKPRRRRYNAKNEPVPHFSHFDFKMNTIQPALWIFSLGFI